MIYRGISAAKRRKLAIEALDKVGLKDKMNTGQRSYPAGSSKECRLLRALSSHPSLILADEPTGALDSKSGIEIMQMLHDLHEEGNTIVIITHDLSIAKQAERIVTIKDGKITSDVDNKDDMADPTNVKASDLHDSTATKAAELEPETQRTGGEG